jgi:hypothetical protein
MGLLGVLNENVRPLGSDGLDEVAASDAEHVVDEAFEFAFGRHGQMGLDEDAIEAVQRADDKAGEPRDELPYWARGILPRLAVVSNNQSCGSMPSSLHDSFCGYAGLFRCFHSLEDGP